MSLYVLTGAPRLAAIMRDYATLELWAECWWDDSESIWREYDSGRRELVRAVWRLRGRIGWMAASEGEALGLASDTAATFALAVRTKRDEDPEWGEEVEATMRRTSPLPATALLRRRLRDGRPAWRVELQVESLATYSAIPGLIEGGFYLNEMNVEEGWAVIEPYPGATADVTTYEVSILNPVTGLVVTGTRAVATLGTPPIAFARVTDHGDGTATIHTTEPPE